MSEDKNKKNKVLGEMDKACGQPVFPTEIAEVDSFIAGILECYGESTGDSLFVGDSLFRNAAADLLGAVVTFVLDYLPDEYHAAGRAIDLLENCSWSDSGQIRDVFNLAICELMSGYRVKYNCNPLTGEQLPYLKPSPLARNSDGSRPSDRVSYGFARGFSPDEDETVNRYCKFTALVSDANMRMSIRYTALALLKYSFPNEVQSDYSIRNVIDDLG